MKKNGVIIVLTLVSAMVLSACTEDPETKEKKKDPITQEEAKNQSDVDKEDIITVLTLEEMYQEIFDEYSAQIREQGPLYLEEYKEETVSEKNLKKLSEVSNLKILKLAEISNAGIEEMTELMMNDKDKAHLYYEEWTTKLTGVFEIEAQKITDAYNSDLLIK